MRPSIPVRVDTRPEPVEVEARRCAVIVVDMQNGFASKGVTSIGLDWIFLERGQR